MDGMLCFTTAMRLATSTSTTEDKFSVLLTTLDVTPRGRPELPREPSSNLPEQPATMTGRGLHFTSRRRRLCRRVANGRLQAAVRRARMERRSHRSTARCNAQAVVRNIVPVQRRVRARSRVRRELFRQFYHERPSPVSTAKRVDHAASVAERLLRKQPQAMGEIDIDPNHGAESDGARWFMTETESIPYSSEQDARIPLGGSCSRASSSPANSRADRGGCPMMPPRLGLPGTGALEVARRLDTKSRYDVPLSDGSLHAGRGLRSQPDQAYPAASGQFVLRWNECGRFAKVTVNDEPFLANCW